ncbi:chemotaxis protein CheW, partial [Candidatus Magnetaquicoccus inordinatus]|uniref:chemotaxis protein CheW n=1 Tax=Candidatus Magnetaquicoccus inordinatus TaxID=2496818 RepID=UPI00102CC395
MKVLTLQLADDLYAVDLVYVREVIELLVDTGSAARTTHITHVPLSSKDVWGVINLRGYVIPVSDLRQKLGMLRSTPTVQSRIVILDGSYRTDKERDDVSTWMGVVVDSVHEVIELAEEEINPPPRSGLQNNRLQGISHHHDTTVLILDVAALFQNAVNEPKRLESKRINPATANKTPASNSAGSTPSANKPAASAPAATAPAPQPSPPPAPPPTLPPPPPPAVEPEPVPALSSPTDNSPPESETVTDAALSASAEEQTSLATPADDSLPATVDAAPVTPPEEPATEEVLSVDIAEEVLSVDIAEEPAKEEILQSERDVHEPEPNDTTLPSAAKDAEEIDSPSSEAASCSTTLADEPLQKSIPDLAAAPTTEENNASAQNSLRAESDTDNSSAETTKVAEQPTLSEPIPSDEITSEEVHSNDTDLSLATAVVDAADALADDNEALAASVPETESLAENALPSVSPALEDQNATHPGFAFVLEDLVTEQEGRALSEQSPIVETHAENDSNINQLANTVDNSAAEPLPEATLDSAETADPIETSESCPVSAEDALSTEEATSSQNSAETEGSTEVNAISLEETEESFSTEESAISLEESADSSSTEESDSSLEKAEESSSTEESAISLEESADSSSTEESAISLEESADSSSTEESDSSLEESADASSTEESDS